MEINLSLGQIQISNLTQRTISIIGGKGSGKTTTLKMIANSVKNPCYIFDPLNVIYIKNFHRLIVGKKHIESGAEAGKAINRAKNQKIIFAFKNLLQEEQITFADGFFSTWQPTNSIICIDEIHEFTPQVGGNYSKEVERAVRHWRNTNNGFVLTSQRPASVNKNVLALTDFLILYRLTWTHDIKAIEEILSNVLSEQELTDVMRTLQTRQFLEGKAIDFITQI